MSLEQAINDHAAAIRELAAAILASARTPAAAPVEVKAEKPTTAKAAVEQALSAAEKASAEKKAKAEAEAAAKQKQAEEDAAAAELAGGSTEQVADLDFDKDVKPAFLAFLKAKGRDAGVALLAEFKAKSGSEVAKADLPKMLAKLQAA